MSRVRFLRAAAAFGVAALLGGLALPALGLVLAEGPTSFCCSSGRCCCADAAAGTDDRTCLRRGCGCEHPDATLARVPLQIEAVLPATSLPAHPEPRLLRGTDADGTVLTRPHAPPVPPPRRPLPA
jgi:hypothetical protein